MFTRTKCFWWQFSMQTNCRIRIGVIISAPGVANQLVSIWIRIGATDKNLSWHYPKNISSLYLFEISHVLRWQSYCRGHLTSKKILKSNFTVCHSMFTVTYSTLFTLKQDRSVIRVPCSDVLLSLNIVWGWGGAGLRSSGQSRLAKTNWPCPKTSQDDDVWPRQAQPVINHARLRHHPHGNIFLVIFFRLFFSFFLSRVWPECCFFLDPFLCVPFVLNPVLMGLFCFWILLTNKHFICTYVL